MMMPANFSVVAENEMTYVIGGGIVDVLPDAFGPDQWAQLGKNAWTLVGNTFVAGLVNATLGTLFTGNYQIGDINAAVTSNLFKVDGFGNGVLRAIALVASVDVLSNNAVTSLISNPGYNKWWDILGIEPKPKK